MTQLALGFGYRKGDDRPSAVPVFCFLVAEGHGSLHCLFDERRRAGIQPVVGVSPSLRGNQQAALAEPVQRCSGAWLAYAELGEKIDQRGRREVLVTAEPVIREQRYEETLRRRSFLASWQAANREQLTVGGGRSGRRFLTRCDGCHTARPAVVSLTGEGSEARHHFTRADGPAEHATYRITGVRHCAYSGRLNPACPAS